MKRKFLCAGLTAAMVLSLASMRGKCGFRQSEAAASGSESQAGGSRRYSRVYCRWYGPLTGSCSVLWYFCAPGALKWQ